MSNSWQNASVRILISLSFILAASIVVSGQAAPGGIVLLEAYEYMGETTFGVLSGAGVIYRDNGLRIEFEEGVSQGYLADRANMARYVWYKEQKINGLTARIALIKAGLKTPWEPDKPRDRKYGNILLVTYPLSDQPNHAINFR